MEKIDCECGYLPLTFHPHEALGAISSYLAPNGFTYVGKTSGKTNHAQHLKEGAGRPLGRWFNIVGEYTRLEPEEKGKTRAFGHRSSTFDADYPIWEAGPGQVHHDQTVFCLVVARGKLKTWTFYRCLILRQVDPLLGL